MLVVQHRRAPAQIPHRRQAPYVEGPGVSHVEEDRENVRLGEATGSIGPADVRSCAGGTGSVNLLVGYAGGENDFFGSAGGGESGGGYGERG